MKKIHAELAISADKDINLEELKDKIFHKLNLIRVYMKEPTKEPDMNEPLIMQGGSTVEDVCNKLHRQFLTKFRFCKVWGKSAKFPGQKLSLKHVLKDEDILEVHLL